jgi:hypothetical protein
VALEQVLDERVVEGAAIQDRLGRAVENGLEVSRFSLLEHVEHGLVLAEEGLDLLGEPRPSA